MKIHEIREYLKTVPFDESKFGNYQDHIRDGREFHLRFDMAGFDYKKITSTEVNNNILLLFAKHGLYKNVEYLFINFYKGDPTVYFRKKRDDFNYVIDDLSGFTTCEIIEYIFTMVS